MSKIEGEAPRYNKETEDAIQEAKDIISGKIDTKAYASFDELKKELEEKFELGISMLSEDFLANGRPEEVPNTRIDLDSE